MDEEERRLIAYHEGGHAMVAHVLPNTDEVHKITVIPRGRALGYTLTLPEQDKFLMTREQLRDELAMLMGGRVAEEIVAGDVTTGAQNDIERATKVARQMVTEYGMSDTIGPRTLGQKQGEVFLGRDWGSTPDYSDAVAFEIDSEVRQLIDEAHDVALDILTENRDEARRARGRAAREGDARPRGGREVLRRHREARCLARRRSAAPASPCRAQRRRSATPPVHARHARRPRSRTRLAAPVADRRPYNPRMPPTAGRRSTATEPSSTGWAASAAPSPACGRTPTRTRSPPGTTGSNPRCRPAAASRTGR